MSRSSILILLGTLVLVVPFLGVPFSWMRILFIILGALVIMMGLFIRREKVKKAQALDATPPTLSEVHAPHEPVKTAQNSNEHPINDISPIA